MRYPYAEPPPADDDRDDLGIHERGPHTYDVAGLATVTLPGVEARVCPTCGEREAVILRMLKTASDARPNGRIVLKLAKMGP